MNNARGLLVLCSSTIADQVGAAISKHAPADWRKRNYVRVVSIPQSRAAESQFVTSLVNAESSAFAGYVQLLGVATRSHPGAPLRAPALEIGALRPSIIFSQADLNLALKTFQLERLPAALIASGLDWLTQISGSVSKWNHGKVERDDLEEWLNQFRVLENNRWIGERLLRLLEFWTSPDVVDALGIGDLDERGFECVAVNRHAPGKSADVIANQVKKRIQYFACNEVTDLWEALNRESEKPVLYVEDCMITGTEVVSLLRSLAGQVPTGRKPKAPPVDDQAKFKTKRLEMRFAVVGNMGLERVTAFTRDAGLSGLTIASPATGVRSVLSRAGVEAFRSGSLYDKAKVIVDVDNNVVTEAFRDVAIWGNLERLNRAKRFCTEVGRQLFLQYLARQGWEWDSRRVDQASLGFNACGLTLAFAHSIPKSSLPLFWADGDVVFGNASLRWFPLFPNAF
jgi:hypothetical protein